MALGDCCFVEVTKNILDIKGGGTERFFSIFAYPKRQSAHQTYSLGLRTKVKEPVSPSCTSQQIKSPAPSPGLSAAQCRVQHPEPCAES